MSTKWLTRMIQVTVVALTAAAICQELEKPKEERTWHGKIAGFVPYNFRLPTPARFKESYWNFYDSRIFTPEVFGLGWAINFHALLEKLSSLRQTSVTELDFLMPTQAMKDLLAQPPAAE